MSFKEQFDKIIPEERDEFTEKVLRKTPAPGCGGLTWGELYDNANNENELAPGEDFFAYIEKVKKAQKRELERPLRKAA